MQRTIKSNTMNFIDYLDSKAVINNEENSITEDGQMEIFNSLIIPGS